MRVDPDGREDGVFLDENGKVIGDDGKVDQKVYVLKTKQQSFDSEAPVNGITKKDYKSTKKFIKKNSGNSEAFSDNSMAYQNSVEIIGDQATRQAMVNVVNQDNGKGGSVDANNREYGGVVRNGIVIPSTAGSVTNPCEAEWANFEYDQIISGDITFHSHPSGSRYCNPINLGQATTVNQINEINAFDQAPSILDVSNATGISYVFGRGSRRVYIYDSSGILATLPHSAFVK